MKGLRLWKWLFNWKLLIIALPCFVIFTYTEPQEIELYQPITDISQAGQYAQFDFTVKKSGDYQFALLFSFNDTGNSIDDKKRRNAILGTDDGKGEVIPVSLRLIKDGKLFSEEIIDSALTIRSQPRRNIKIVNLPVGRYSAVITTLEDRPNFDDIYSQAYLVYFTSEHLEEIRQKNLAHAKRMKSEWYRNWLFAKWLVGGFFCAAFCPEPAAVQKPIDLSQAGQSVKYDFVLKEVGGVQFYLMFSFGKDSEERRKRSSLFGSIKDDGIVIPLSIYLVKDGREYYFKKIITRGTGSTRTAYYGGKEFNTRVRNVEALDLPPGHYTAVITTLENIPDFQLIEIFMELNLY
ncbi:DUF5625 family protein [Pantoea agglomerans]